MKVELIPVIELGFKEEEGHFIQPCPGNLYWVNLEEWEEIFKAKVKKNGYEDYQRIAEGYPFYRVNQFKSKEDLLKIIHFHLGGEEDENRTPLKDSCALFGGYVLKIDQRIVFTPQCCSTLSDFSTWESIIQDNFRNGYICNEGHPNPRVKRAGDKLKFTFEEDWEEFIPPAINSIVDRREMRKAIKKCKIELDEFGSILNSLELELNQKGIADILIYAKH